MVQRWEVIQVGFENYDNLWKELEAVGKKYGYQLSILHNDPNVKAEDSDEEITAIFLKEDKE